MKQAQETSDFYPTRRASEAPPEQVIGGGFKPDLSDTPDLPESGVTLKHVRETVRGILSALKGTATLLAVAVSAMLMAESITGTEGEMLENLPGDSTVILDAPAVKQLLQGKADKRHTHADLQQAIVNALEAELEQEARVREMADAEIVDALEGKVSFLRTAPAAPSNNANCYGYRGTLRALGATGEAVVVGRVAVLTRASGNQNTGVSLWARLLRNVNGAWVVAAQAKTSRKWSDVSAGSELAWEMVSVDGVTPPSADEEIAIVWVNNSEAGASTSNGSLSFQTIDLAGGLQYELPASPTISSSRAAWSPRIVLDYAPFSSGDTSGEGSVTTIDETTTFTSSDGTKTMTLPWNAEPNVYSEDGAIGVAAIYGSGLDGFAVTDGKGNAVDLTVSGNYGGVSVKVGAYGGDQWSRYVLPKAIDSSLNATSTNPVQNKVLYDALSKKQNKDDSTARMSKSSSPQVWYNSVLINGADRLFFDNSNVESMLLQSKDGEGSISWYTGSGIATFPLGGGNTEVWKGNVGFGEQDTFFGPRRVADGEGQFYKGYPRLHNHGQDIHEVSGFSRDSRDDESVWSHRLLLPWDLAKANDTSYLMAGVVWDGNRNLFANGDTATFVQPLLPQNSGSTQSALPYAIPCFENSPVYWKGTIIWNDGTQAISKAVQIPWARVKHDMRGPDELALKRDIPSIDAALSTTSTNPVQNKAVKAELDKKQNQLTAGANVTLAEDGTISATCPSADTGWVSPGDWTLSVTPAEEYAVIDSSVVVWTNNVQQVIGTASSSTLSAAAKMVSLEMLDVAQPAPTVSFACEGATITRGDNAQSALVTAEAEGLYRVSATDDTGRMRTAYLSIRAKEKSTKVEQAYLADVPGTARANANDAMLAALQTRDTSTTMQSGITAAVATGDLCFDTSGAPLSTAPLAPRFFCGVEPSRAWGPDAVAVAPHFAVTAAHWNPAQAKTATFRTPEGASVTVSGTYGISLVEWARQRGYSESEIRDADLADIWVWQFDNGTIPEACIPSVLDRSAWEHYYRSDLTGVACYAVTQNGYLSFGELLHPDGGAYSIGSFTPERTRADLLATLSPPACALIYGGDSGRPVMMIHAGEPVLLSTFWTAGSGPSMIKACNILDDLIKTRSGGTESLKRISAP